jgi:hypothetical protein
MMKHPRDPRHVLGAGSKWVFEPRDFEDILLWKGLIPAGDHGFGNNLILQGNTSSYSLSFSSLIAQALARDNLRPLHYVMMANRPANLFTNSAMLEGNGIPICIPNLEQFKGMTQLDKNDLSSAGAQKALLETVQSLTSNVLGEKVKLPGSESITHSFGSHFSGANMIYGSDFSEHPEFRFLWKRYAVAMLKAVQNASKNQNLMNRAKLFTTRAHRNFYHDLPFSDFNKIKLAPLPTWEQVVKSLEIYKNDLNDFLQDMTRNSAQIHFTSNYYWRRMVRQAYAYAFAFADFLVRKDLSAVVDVPAWEGISDWHGEHMEELYVLIGAFAGFNEMIKSLKEISLPGQGGTLFDATFMTLHTEFDRWAFHEPKGETASRLGIPQHIGTNHGSTASLLMAGYGVNRGKVVGEIHQGAGLHGAYGLSSNDYLRPLPIDPKTGQVKPISEGGQKISTLAILPTILKMFGVQVPLQQITNWEAIDAVIKAG